MLKIKKNEEKGQFVLIYCINLVYQLTWILSNYSFNLRIQ